MTITPHHSLALQCPFKLHSQLHLLIYLVSSINILAFKNMSKYSKDANITSNPIHYSSRTSRDQLMQQAFTAKTPKQFTISQTQKHHHSEEDIQ